MFFACGPCLETQLGSAAFLTLGSKRHPGFVRLSCSFGLDLFSNELGDLPFPFEEVCLLGLALL